MTVGTKPKVKWGDEDEDDVNEYETPVDANGVKERIRITVNAKGQKVKTVTKIRVREVKIKVPKAVASRRNLPKFGEAVEGEVNVTLLSKDFISIEHPDDQLLGDDGNDPGLSSNLGEFMQKMEQRKMEREFDLDHNNNSSSDEMKRALENSRLETGDASSASASTSGKYVPPSQRGGARSLESAFGGGASGGASSRENDNTIRVSNLTKSITDDDLRDLFSRFGDISRISLPRGPDREPRGFAYVSFYNRKDAEYALDKLNGYGYDHLILKLEWAKPPSSDPNQEPSSSLFKSGYGTQLAQDTKEKVSYASNLSGNK